MLRTFGKFYLILICFQNDVKYYILITLNIVMCFLTKNESLVQQISQPRVIHNKLLYFPAPSRHTIRQ